MSCVVQSPSLHEFESCAVVFAETTKKIVTGSPRPLERAMGSFFFFHGLGSNLITTVGSQRDPEIIISRKRAKKKCHGP
jgi:hypothetical protein